MNATALRKIAADLDRLARDTTPDNPCPPFDLSVLARQVAEQADMIEKGLVE